MESTFNCPKCSAPLEYSGNGDIVHCPYCGTSVIVPEELRPKQKPKSSPGTEVGDGNVSSEQMDEIKLLVREGKKIEAIKLFRQATSAGLKEAKDAIDAIEAGDPELKNRPKATAPVKKGIGVILVGLFFFGIASIFPIVFIPSGIQLWQMGEYAGAIFSVLGAAIWAVVWGGIGGLILFAKY